MTREISALTEIEDLFDAVIVDQYGVLHNGQSAYPGALRALQIMSKKGIPVVALTNSGKLARTNISRLAAMGFLEELFCGVVSSGELARNRLADMAPRTEILLIAREGERELIDGLDVRLALPGQPVDLIVLAAVEPFKRGLADYSDVLKRYASDKAPMLLVNPDLLLVENGRTAFGPGAVANEYRRMGGFVEVLGKPARPMFDVSRQVLGGLLAERVLMIGDSPHHDIGGAAAAGMKTLLIRDGVQSDLGGVEADFVMDKLVWD